MTDVFQEPTRTITENIETVNTGNQFENLVGADKKYKTQEDLARAALEKDRFISQLLSEAKGRQAELDRAVASQATDSRLDEILTKLSQPTIFRQGDPTTLSTGVTSPQEPAVKTPTAEDIAEMVRKTIEQDRVQTQAQKNADQVIQAMKKAYGSDYPNRLKQRTQELGLSEQDMNTLAARSPQAFLDLVQLPVTQRNPEPPRQAMNSDGFNQTFSQEKTYSDFEKMRTAQDAATRARYWSPAVQMEIHTLGEKALKDGDPDRFFK